MRDKKVTEEKIQKKMTLGKEKKSPFYFPKKIIQKKRRERRMKRKMKIYRLSSSWSPESSSSIPAKGLERESLLVRREIAAIVSLICCFWIFLEKECH